MTADHHPRSVEAAREGARRLAEAPALHRAAVLLLFLLSLLMLPIGRRGPADGGGLLAPLTVDSGVLFRTRPAVDFFCVYDAGARALMGRDPFGVNLDTGKPGVRAPYVATFRYLPITAYWLGIPLNILPPWPAFYVWCCINIIFLVANFFLCVGRNPSALLPFAVVWFGWFPTIAELHMGQFSLLLGTLLLWGMDALCAGRRWGGIAWIFAVLLKVFPLAMAPSLFLWGRKRIATSAVLLCVVGTAPWFLFSNAINEGLVNRGASGRIVSEAHKPYAGAQGTQELVNAIVWKASGQSFGDEHVSPGTPAFMVTAGNAVILVGYGLLCLWAVWRSRKSPNPHTIALLWMTWYIAYRDCWEHHYMFMQALLGFMLAWRALPARVILLAWLFAGAPSLWWLWQRTGYAGNGATELIGLLYFVQRPIALLVIGFSCIRSLRGRTAS
ncbi:DUF2029 domain-containing protein [Candidatus Sumerlaeota bacterium]|nr:DUF2029 domain-containing protein [Candidatus Sumerlaeota bacterium]